MAHTLASKVLVVNTMNTVKTFLIYFVGLLILFGAIDIFAELPLTWSNITLICVLVAALLTTREAKRPFSDLESKYRTQRRVQDTERDARR